MTTPNIQPPKWATKFLAWYCKPELLEDLQGDLNEFFYRHVKEKGIRKARLIYMIDVIKFLRLYTIRKPSFVNILIQWIMLGSYFKTSGRNILRNKLFSSINIIGLAISMSVGLVLIAFVVELKSFDKFHKNYNRIYRVKSTYESISNNGIDEYASTSVLAGKKISESISGVEKVAILRSNFNADLHVGEKTIPLEGFWASEEFLNIFSFQLLGGNAETALGELNSIVLTSSAAKKLYGRDDVVGSQVLVDTTNYTITAVVKDPPLNSHLRFDMLGSFITIDTKRQNDNDKNWMKWDYIWQNYVYLLVPEKRNLESISKSFAEISDEQNKTLENETINIYPQPLSEVVISADLSNNIGPNFSKSLLVVLGGLALIVVISACFNYTNLSIARALRRAREVGIRKVVGASKGQVFSQFIVEAIIISLLSLIFAFFIFLLIRPSFISLDSSIQEMVTLEPAPIIYLLFVAMAVGVGILAGLFPALFFSKMNTIKVLKNLSSIQLFKHINFRKVLIVFQYTLSIGFIVAVSIGYRQYQYSIAFDLGLTTENILNIDLQNNKPELVIKELTELPEVKNISKSLYVTAVGTSWSGYFRGDDPQDSTNFYYNYVDEHFISMHEIKLLAGKNFSSKISEDSDDASIIINQKLLKWMNLENPEDAVGKEVFMNGKKCTVIGVMQDFHHNKLNNPISYFAFRYFNKLPSHWSGVVNLKVQTPDVMGMMDKINAAWKKVDPIHPLKATFYDEKIKKAYAEMTGMIKIIGFLAFLSISIASMGLLGMVVFTTETRIREISVRKVFGATERSLIMLMSKGFILLLTISSLIAIPAAYFLFDQMIFARIAYRAPLGFIDLFSGTFIVLSIALLAISSQTLKVARVNPSTTLRNE